MCSSDLSIVVNAIRALMQRVPGSLALLVSLLPLLVSIGLLMMNRSFGLGISAAAGQWWLLVGSVLLSAGLSVALAHRLKNLSRVQKSYQHDMDAARQKLQASSNAALLAQRENEIKTAFLATMSHEIRTPMNGILGMAELLKSTDIDAQQSYYLDTLKRSGQTLMGILNDILDYTKGESGRIQLEKVAVDLPTLLDDLSVMFQEQMQRKSLDFYTYLGHATPLRVVTDPTRLKQILANLLSNAVKFTDAGEISLRLEYVDPYLEIAVQDSGIGMSSEQKKQLFQRFHQADSSISRKYGGTGLGLAICKQLTELMGGEIAVESETGQGSCIRLRLPMEAAMPDPKKYGTHRLVLCSDDSRLYHSIEMLLEKYSIPTLHASDRSQLDVLNLTAADLLLVDEEYTRISPDEYPCGLASLGSRMADCDITRPLHFGKLLHLLEMYSGAEKSSTETNIKTSSTDRDGFPQGQDHLEKVLADTHPSPLATLSVLVAEDNPTNQLVVGKLLTNWGAEVRFANNGREAVDVYDASHSEIDLVLMDCEMPEMDGYAATTEIRRIENRFQMNAVPVIALTAHALPEFRERATDVGMTDYITKPIDKALLLKALKGAVSDHHIV